MTNTLNMIVVITTSKGAHSTLITTIGCRPCAHWHRYYMYEFFSYIRAGILNYRTIDTSIFTTPAIIRPSIFSFRTYIQRATSYCTKFGVELWFMGVE